MLAVTRRPEIRARLVRVSADFGLPSPTFHCSVEEALAARGDAALIFLDLSCCCGERGLRHSVERWLRRSPGTELVLFVPLIDRECETHAMFDIAALGVGRVMTASDFMRAEVWLTVQKAQHVAVLQKELLDDFRRAVEATGRPLRAPEIVQRIVVNVPTNAACLRMAAWDGEAGSAAAQRKALWKQLRTAGQMPASWLVLTFRVLWYAKLREAGLSTSRIATFLGFRTPRHLRMTLKRRFGVCMKELHQVRYDDALAWSAELCTRDQSRVAGRAGAVLDHPPLPVRNKPAPRRDRSAPASGN